MPHDALDSYEICEISKNTLTTWFNEGQYWDRSRYGDLFQVLVEDGHPSAPLAGEPFCTRSQLIIYETEDGEEIAQVHQYLRQDGSIGLSGRPDPQMLKIDGTVYGI